MDFCSGEDAGLHEEAANVKPTVCLVLPHQGVIRCVASGKVQHFSGWWSLWEHTVDSHVDLKKN